MSNAPWPPQPSENPWAARPDDDADDEPIIQPGFGPPPATRAAPPPPAHGSGYFAPPPIGADWMGTAPEYASWGSRVLALLIEGAVGVGIVIVGLILAVVFGSISSALGALALISTYVGMFAWYIWNLIRQGTTGQSFGKEKMGIRLVGLESGQPIGAWMSVGRALLHIVDSTPLYLGYLWPLWDDKRQTFADKILSTVVVTDRQI